MKNSLSIFLPIVAALPLFAQEPVAQPVAEIVAVEIPAPAVSLEQFEALKADDQKQNMILSGLSEQINSQRLLLEDSKIAIQEQGVLYERNSKHLADLTKRLEDALLTNSQLKESILAYSKNLAISEEEAAQKSVRIEALVQKLSLMEQTAAVQSKAVDELLSDLKKAKDELGAELATMKNRVDEADLTSALILSELKELRDVVTAQVKLSDERAARLALEVAQVKVDLADYQGKQAVESAKLVNNMAAGMVLLFLCVVVISFIFRMHVRKLKNGVLAGVNAKLAETSQEIRQLVNQSAKPVTKGKPRSQR